MKQAVRFSIVEAPGGRVHSIQWIVVSFTYLHSPHSIGSACFEALVIFWGLFRDQSGSRRLKTAGRGRSAAKLCAFQTKPYPASVDQVVFGELLVYAKLMLLPWHLDSTSTPKSYT